MPEPMICYEAGQHYSHDEVPHWFKRSYYWIAPNGLLGVNTIWFDQKDGLYKLLDHWNRSDWKYVSVP